MIRRVLPNPLLSAALFALWLLLNRSFAPGQILLGALLAVLAPVLSRPLRPQVARMRRPLLLLRFILRVGRDVIVSNFQVGRGVLRARWQPPAGGFVLVPLDLRDPHGLAALAVVTAVVPGTVWCELALDRSALLLHVFHVTDEAAFIAHFKNDYERPLMEIFE